MLPICAWFAAAVVCAQPASPLITARSFSGQFVAKEMRGRPHWGPSPEAVRAPIAGSMAFLLTAPPVSPLVPQDQIPLEPALLVVSCERVKELFLLELGLADNWRGRIDLLINRYWPDDHAPALTAVHSRDGWNYELELPKSIQPQLLVRALMQTLLTEIANREAGSTSAEIPFWLVDGMSAHLQAFNLPTFILRPNVQSAGYQRLTIGGMEEVRAVLRQRAPLSFQQLSWPDQSNVTGKDEALYRSCAQLLFESLLRLDDGQVCLRSMLLEMHKHLNWQTAFLLAFHSHFSSLLSVEKWWGLNCVNFTAADLAGPGLAQACWHKLQDALDVPVEVQITQSHAPAEARLTLQEVITQWKPADAIAALQRTVRGLSGLELFTYKGDLNIDASAAVGDVKKNQREMAAIQASISKELSPLVTSYMAVLANYIKHSRGGGTVTPDGKGRYSTSQSVKNETIKQLNILDQQRAAIRDKFVHASAHSDLSAADSSLLKKAKSVP